MKKLTPAMLGALLLAGSGTAVLAAGTGATDPTMSPPAATRPDMTQDQAGQNRASATPMGPQAAQNPPAAPSTEPPGTGSQHSSAGTPNEWRGAEAHHRMASADPVGERMTEALNILSAGGYTSIESLTPQGQQIAATAVVDGHNVSVLVDPQTHQITKQG